MHKGMSTAHLGSVIYPTPTDLHNGMYITTALASNEAHTRVIQ